VLAGNTDRINIDFLKQYESFRAFLSRGKPPQPAPAPADHGNGSTPDELLREAHDQINSALANELLESIRSASPQFFERLIVSLLLGMGYGGTSEDAARSLGKSGDDGVDGVVDQDPLGVDRIYIQAKRYAEGNSVGAGAIRDFFGALSLKKAQKGIFFTSSGFSESARRTAKDLGARIVLIDGERLARLMIEHNVGCRRGDVIELKKIDEDFFDQEI